MFCKRNLSDASYDTRKNLIYFDVHVATKLRAIFFSSSQERIYNSALPLGGTQEFVTLLSFSICLPPRFSPLQRHPREKLNYLHNVINCFKNKINEQS